MSFEPDHKVLIADLETTVEFFTDGRRPDNSPFNPLNRCVSAHWGWIGWDTVEDYQHSIYYHNEYPTPDSPDAFQAALYKAEIVVFHNAKFDVQWLQEMGFVIPDTLKIYCSMIAEFILQKSRRNPVSLKMSAERRNLRSQKKSDLIDGLFKEQIGFEAMPLDTMLEYAEADIHTTGELYLQQQSDFYADENKSLVTVCDHMNDMLLFLVEIERNGAYIDLDVLKKVETDFLNEKNDLTERLNQIVEVVMGDTPINLNSQDDMTKVVYSRTVIDKPSHKLTFNIGTNEAGKSLRPPHMTPAQFNAAVRSTTKIVYKTDAVSCCDCRGVGTIQKFKMVTKIKLGKKYKVSGDPYKNRTKCKTCSGLGAIYQDNGRVAGLKMVPDNAFDAAMGGFKTDKETIKRLIAKAETKNNDTAVEFLTKISRLNAITTYLDSFVAGIEKGTRSDGLLHANFNQCVAATGRLSSSGPNLQNQPKRGFPVRSAIVSRFKNGKIIEGDYSGLEFRTACELSRDAQGIADILEGKDIHRQTASIINQCSTTEVTKDARQQAKAFSFLPLFGGTSFGHPPHIAAYLDGFYDIYKGIHSWHEQLMTGTLKNGIVQTPSGRQYFWPNVVRTRGGRVSNATQILNYPVQGFAADTVQLACIRAHRLFKKNKLESKLILTVHDSIVVDATEDEYEKVISILQEAMVGVPEEIEHRYNYKCVVPLDIEISVGDNWLDQSEIVLTPTPN
mgnify:CR=1 FL=1